ncbi:MAG TPA: peptide-N4-asparagine amidase [Candidatus Baltobacteraceae bacterium]|nr:peptide-N4-asparagine amidase [Candidatus Baltobacteraceae bacterium]
MRLAAMMLTICLLGAGLRTYQPEVVAPPLPVQAGAHCRVQIFRAARFQGDAPRLADFVPPAACRGPWSRVVLTWHTRIAGRQYDRIGELYVGRREVFRFSTAEPTRHGIDYTVKADLTRYAPILREPQPVVAELANYVNKRYDGIYVIDADLTFYQAAPHAPVAEAADAIVPLENEANTVPAFHLQTPQDRASATLQHLPRNIVHAELEVYSTQHGCDEFYYDNQPDAFAAKHKSDGLCGGGAYREIDVYIDGRVANVIYPFPWIYTGGVNPILWRPIPSIDALNIPPYRVDLDPFAGVLSDGKPHTVAIGVVNDRGDWITDANLFLTLDRSVSHTGGAILSQSFSPLDKLRETQSAAQGAFDFKTSASRVFHIEGYVSTPHGRVVHAITTHMSFSNAQMLDLQTGRQNAVQSLKYVTATSMKTGSQQAQRRIVTASYPLIVDSVYTPVKRSGKYDLQIRAYVDQQRNVSGEDHTCRDRVVAFATYDRAKTEAATIAHGHTSQSYRCTGKAGSFVIQKTANDGDVRP